MIANPSGRPELILVYHAVVETPLEVPDPCFVDAAHFREQIARLTESFEVVSLSEYVTELGKRPSRPIAALTFDDGFLNNYTVALPILEEFRIPATVFVVTGLIDSDRTLWFCEINRAVTLTELTSLSWAGEEFDLSTVEARAKASIHFQSALKSRSPSDLRRGVETLLDDLGVANPEPQSLESPYRMLTSDALRAMSASGLIEIGAHTRTHPILTRCSREEQEAEITGSIRDVEELTGSPCRIFAYPNGMPGDYDRTALEILRNSTIDAAVTAHPGTNDRSTSHLELHRQGFSSDLAVPKWATTTRATLPGVAAEKPLRILFAYPFCGLGGVETATLSKIDGLDRAGIEAWIYFHRLYGGGATDFVAHPRVMIGLEDEATLAALLNQDWDAISLIDYPALLPIIDRYDITPDVLFESHAGLSSFQDRVYPQLTHPRIRAIVVPSRTNADRLRAEFVPQAPIFVLPNAVDGPLFDPSVVGEGLSGITLREGEVPVLWIGRLEPEKNPEEMVAIANLLIERGEQVRFVMVGDAPGSYDSALARLQGLMSAATLDAVSFVRAVPYAQMPDLYRWVAQHGGALISTSRFETQPMIFLEAMAARLPVVSSLVGSLGELIADGVTGRLYPLGDTEAAADSLLDVLRRTPATMEMVDVARAMVLADHSPEAVGRSYRRLLEGLGLPKARAAPPRVDRSDPAGEDGLGRGMVPGLVSTIIPLHDRPALLRQAIASVQAQSYESLEIVLADDGSELPTALMCDRLAEIDSRIHVIHLDHIGLAGPVREAGRGVARGEFIQYLDSDDLLTPRKFEVMVRALRAHPDRDIAYCLTRRYIVGEQRSDVPAERTGEAHTDMLPSFLSQRYWHASTPIYRRSVTDQAGPWTDLRAWEDIEYDMRVASTSPRLVYCPEYLTDVRDHRSSRLSRQYWFNDPWMLGEALRAFALVHGHAVRGGMSIRDDEMHDLLEDVRFITFHCQKLALESEVERGTALLREIAGDQPIGPIAMPTLAADLRPEQSFVAVEPGTTFKLPVRIVNRSSISLRHGLLPIGLSYHLFAENGDVVAWDGPRVFFSPPLRRGEERVMTLPVTAPPVRGRYLVEVDLVWESVTWFKDAGSQTATVHMLVGAPPAVEEEPLVSVVIPAFNQAEYLPEAVESVRWQTYENWECIIVDDGSTDETAVVANALAAQDHRVRYHHQANHGLSAARNVGLTLATGKYVQFLDADDAIAPSKLRRQVALMESAPSVGVTYSNFWRFDGRTGRPIDRTDLRLGPRPLEDFLFAWERGLTIPIHAALFRRELWPDGAPFDQRLHGREDWLMWVDLALRDTEMVFVDADLAWYRIHDRNMVRDQTEMLRLLIQAAQLIGPRLPPQYQRLFVDETVRYVTQSARALLSNDAPEEARPLHGAVEGLEMLAHQLRRAGVAADAASDVIDELRVLAAACRRQGLEADAERCDAAAQMVAGPERLLEPARLMVNLKPAREELTTSANEAVVLPVLVRNESNVALGDGTYAKFALSYHVRNEDGTVVAWDNARVMFEQTLRSGEERLFSLTIAAPSEAGRYEIEVDVVCEGVTWLAEVGSRTALVALTVSTGPATMPASAAAAKKPSAKAADRAKRLSQSPGGGVAH